MKQDSKQRLVEVMTRLDKTFKPKLSEGFGGKTDDPTKEEMMGFLTNEFQGLVDPMETDANNFDMEAAIYWFANHFHSGQWSNLYSVLSTSEFRPGPMQRSIDDLESGTATEMYNGLVQKYGGEKQQYAAEDVDEVFGWSGKEKDAKANQQTIEAAKQEIQKYPPSHIFGQPGRNSAPQDDKNLMSVRLNMAKQYMPTLAELMPQLFDLTQGYGDMVQIYNGKPLKGLVPSNWYYFLRGGEGYLDNEQAVRKLNQEIDALGQKMGLGENIHNNIYDGGILNSKNTAGYNPDATNTPKTPDALTVGHNIYREVKDLINSQVGDEVWGGGAENALKFYVKVLEGLSDALYQDLGDSVNPNAGAAPDEMQ